MLKFGEHLLTRVALILFILIFSSTAARAVQTLTDTYSKQVAKFYDIAPSTSFTLLKIKGYQQSEDYTCGPAAIMSLLHYYGKLSDAQMTKATELKIAAEMGTSKDKGSSEQQMATWLKHHGFNVKMGYKGSLSLLHKNLQKGIPTIVDWIDWGGHWVVVSGYNMAGKTPNPKKDLLFFADPAVNDDSIRSMNGLDYVNADRFASMWFNSKLVRGIYIIATPNRGSQRTSF